MTTRYLSKESFKKYLNPKNYYYYSLSIFNRYFLGALEKLTSRNYNIPLDHPPIFFLGAPRSGSTLMIQVITDVFDFGYISNSHCRWFGAPGLVERLIRPTANRPGSDYVSEHGFVKGSYAPSECGEWWYRFFRHNPPYVTLNDVDPDKMHNFRRSIVSLTDAFDRPILFKNLYASLRLQAIAHYVPECLFIVTHRNEIDNGHSLLEGRYKKYKSYTPWFSIEPPEIEKLKLLPVHQQVIEQIRSIHAIIERDFLVAGISPKRRIDLCYEEFCQNPTASMNKLEAFFKSNNCIVKRRGKIPENFLRRSDVRIDNDLYQAMEKYVQESRVR